MQVKATISKKDVLKALRAKLEEAGNKRLKVGVIKSHTYPNRRSYYGGPLYVAEVAKYFEYGWVQQVTPKQSAYLSSWLEAVGEEPVPPGTVLYQPPRPFMRGTFADKCEDWAKIAAAAFARELDAAKALEVAGFAAAQDVRISLVEGRAGGVEFAPRSPMTLALHEAKAAGHEMDGTPSHTTSAKAGMQTGMLAHSIDFEVT